MRSDSFDKRKLKIHIIGIFLFTFLLFLFLVTPVYEREDENFRNILSGGNKYWHDGISPLMFAHFENYLKNKEIGLPESTEVDKFNKLNVSNYVDEICISTKCYPIFYTISLYGFFEFLAWMKKIFSLSTLQYLLIVNSIIYAFSIMVLFFILNKIKRKPLLTFFVSLFVGLGTSFFIYPKYLFLHNSLQAFFFVLFLYSFLLFEEKKSKRRFIIFTLSSVLFIISWQALSSIVIAIFMAFWFTYFNFERINRRFYIAYIFVLGITVLIELKVFLDFFFMSAEAGKLIFRGRSLFYNLYDESFYAIDFVPVSPLYSTNISNALFLKLYPLFGFFFGVRGIFVNSPFLLFSLPGIITFNNKRLKTQLLALLIFFILAFAYFHADYEGGFSPRYVRHSEIIIVILTIFLASYFSKLKNRIILLIFIPLVFVSMTNSISLAIRTDWSYEKITDLVSYDIVLWPWLPVKQESLILDLTKPSEQSKWNFTWEVGCNPPNTPPIKTSNGIVLGPCDCSYSNSIERIIFIPKKFSTLKLSACATSAGLDGVMVYLKIDERKWRMFFKSNSCEDYYINISDYADDKNHKISIYAGIYGICNDEHVYLKKIVLLPISSNENVGIYNLVGERNDWVLGGEANCLPLFINDYIFVDNCFCMFHSNLTRSLDKKSYVLNITACSRYAGGDGTILVITLDGTKQLKVFLESNSCKKVEYFEPNGFKNIAFTVESYGLCYDEGVLIKELMIN